MQFPSRMKTTTAWQLMPSLSTRVDVHKKKIISCVRELSPRAPAISSGPSRRVRLDKPTLCISVYFDGMRILTQSSKKMNSMSKLSRKCLWNSFLSAWEHRVVFPASGGAQMPFAVYVTKTLSSRSQRTRWYRLQ